MQRVTQGAVVLILLTFGHQSLAQSNRFFDLPQWTGGPQVNPKSKQFERCSASTKNDSGITINYSVDRNFIWQVGFANPNWDFGAGHKLRVTIRTGDDDFRNLIATATTNKTFTIEVSDPIALFDRLRTNRSMRVEAGGLHWDFSTSDTNEAMAALVSCVIQHTTRGARKKSAAPTSGKPLELAPARDTRSEAKAISASILAQIGLTGFQYTAPSAAFPVGRADAAWRKDGVTGVLSVMSDRKWDHDTLAHDILSGSAQPCRGHLFVIAAPSTIDRTRIARVLLSCRDVEQAVSAYYLALPRAAGGYFQIATLKSGIELGPQRNAEDLDLRIREVIVGVIAKHDSAPQP
jgi:hypothetical protein